MVRNTGIVVDVAPAQELSAPYRGSAGGRWAAAAAALHEWMWARGYAGHDPQDTLASPIAGRLTFGSRWLGVAWIQLGQRAPVDLRQLLRVPALRNAKGAGLTLAACTRLAMSTTPQAWRARAAELVDWLVRDAVPGAHGAGWGYPFPWANRDFFAPAGTPNSVATAYVVHALLDAGDALGDARCGPLACAGARWIATSLQRIPGSGDTFAFSYTPIDRRVVHNASLLAASAMSRALRDDPAVQRDAYAAARYTAAAQRPDGSWPYGAGRRNAWVDSFHTGYLLVALDAIARSLGTSEWDDVLERGIAYWQRAFFIGEAVGLRPFRPHPVEMHAVAHAIVALRALRNRAAAAHATAQRLGEWALATMRARDGSFFHRHNGRTVDRRRYMRWTQAWMLLALAELAMWEAGG
jgi:polysaccharide biosynthesis protein VpsJ